MRAKLIYESLQFQRGSDPRQILNIGQRAIIENWFRDIERQKGRNIDYSIDDKLNVIVKQSLWLSGLDIDWLPDNLSVGGINLRNTNITELPDNLKIKGSLYLNNTNITELPDNLRVGGSLDLRNTKITELPDNLTVGGWLDLSNTNITELPEDLKVGGKIYKDF